MRILLRDLHLASFADPSGYGEIRDAAVITDGSWIAWVGRERDLPARLDVDVDDEIGLGGGWLLPGLIDCHTHLVYAGSRADEFEARLHGATYEQIAARGGGILATMRAVRAADVDTLVAASSRRLRSLIEDGVTTVEIKSGYGLDLDSERRMLQAARRLGRDVRVVTTFLGAHATPPGFTADAWIDEIVDEILPKLAAEGLVDAVDAFCETIGFSLDQVDRLFDAAEAFGLPIKVHAEQLSYQGGARSIAGRRGLSADHLEWLCDEDVEFMAEMGTVAVLLPGAFYCLRETRLPPIDRLREAGVPMAVATDLNPGTSPVCSLLAALNLACTLFRLTPEEALAGVTRHAARALGLPDIGAVAVGLRADLTGWAIDRPADLCQHLGLRAMTLRMLGGRITHGGK